MRNTENISKSKKKSRNENVIPKENDCTPAIYRNVTTDNEIKSPAIRRFFRSFISVRNEL